MNAVLPFLFGGTFSLTHSINQSIIFFEVSILFLLVFQFFCLLVCID